MIKISAFLKWIVTIDWIRAKPITIKCRLSYLSVTLSIVTLCVHLLWGWGIQYTYWKDLQKQSVLAGLLCIQSNCIFKTCLLSELLGGWYTCPLMQPTEVDSSTNSESQLQDDSQCKSSSQLGRVYQVSILTFCYCKGPEIDNGSLWQSRLYHWVVPFEVFKDHYWFYSQGKMVLSRF